LPFSAPLRFRGEKWPRRRERAMFLNSLLLYGTVLGSVPIIIHLLNRSRFRPVTWAAMEFLLQAIQKNSRRLQIRDLILMLLRAAAVICLALALSRPTLSGKGIFGGNKTAAVILLDNSLSMGYHNGHETRFDVAKRLTRQVLSQLESGSWCALHTFNDDVGKPLGDPSQNLNYLEQELDRAVMLSDGGTNIEKAIAAAQKLFAENQEYRIANREVYIITDMQAAPWKSAQVTGAFKQQLKEIGANAGVYLINAGDSGNSNVAITDLVPNDMLVAVDTPVKFVATVKNFSNTDQIGIAVDLYIDAAKDGRPIEKRTLDIKNQDSATVTFETRFAKGGDHKVEVRLADDSGLTADNRRYCTIEVVDQSNVLVVDGRDQRSGDPLASETAYLQMVLSPEDMENPDRQPVFRTEVISQYRLTDKNLLNYKAVVLANVPRVPQATVTTLERMVKGGMGLVIFLGDQTEPQTYETMMGEGATKLLPAKIGPAWGEVQPQNAKEEQPSLSFATEIDKLGHPIMSEFNNPDIGVESLTTCKIFRGYELTPHTDDNVRVVAYLSNGKPAIVERKIGSGYVLLCAFPATTAWSNFPTQHSFIIFMIRAINMLTLGSQPPKNLMVTEPIRCIVPLADTNTKVKITPPGVSAVKDAQPQPTNDGRASFDFKETQRAGFYDILLERTPKLELVYALNPNTSVESDLRTTTSENLKLDYPEFDFNFVGKSEDFDNKLVGERRGTEIWPWLLALVFIWLAFESVLANRWAPRD
jgi:hypothetical protein